MMQESYIDGRKKVKKRKFEWDKKIFVEYITVGVTRSEKYGKKKNYAITHKPR